MAGATKSGRQTRPRILLAEDDLAIAALLKRALSTQYDVIHAEDGPGALALAAKPPLPDLALLDVMMPGIDGFGVAQRFKLMPNLARLPIIFLTAKDTPRDHIKGIQAGGRAYITKPFKLTEVLEKVRKALGS